MNQLIASRLNGIHSVLCSAFESGDLLSSASKGYERETFISLFLNEVLPPIYRFGTGDITDALNNSDSSRRSGQIDIVIEMPWAPSFPVAGASARLYPSETVGTAIEVKSNLSTQWNEIVRTATALDPLRQRLSGISVDGSALSFREETEESIPLYAVGYDGWSTEAIVREKAHSASLDGVLVLKHKIFAWSDRRSFHERLKKAQDALEKKRTGATYNGTMATCAMVANLIQADNTHEQIATLLNSEQFIAERSHLGNEKYLPTVNMGAWTASNVAQLCDVFLQKTNVLTGNEALLQFIAVIHKEVGKRAAMSVDLLGYAK